MGRMSFRIIPRDGKDGIWFRDAAPYDDSAVGRYEMFIDDYADDVCEGETQTAKCAYCKDATALLARWLEVPDFGCGKKSTLGEITKSMSKRIADMDEFYELCKLTGVEYETLPLFVEQHDNY